jgi:hypothetical protein
MFSLSNVNFLFRSPRTEFCLFLELIIHFFAAVVLLALRYLVMKPESFGMLHVMILKITGGPISRFHGDC